MAAILPFSSPPPTHEELFVSRYAWLLERARRLTATTTHDPRELVQEAFVRFAIARPPLDEIRDLDAYLLRVLRNLHLSRLRQSRHGAETSLSLLDFDSAELGLSTLDPRLRLIARDELWAACRFASVRACRSKSGSVFLLRFVHGYVPSEVALVLRTNVRTVDEWLAIARRELKRQASTPAQGAPRSTPAGLLPAAVPNTGDPADVDACVDALRSLVFSARHARCLTPDRLRALYTGPEHAAIPTKVLAEIVTCPRCLDAVDAMLRLGDRAARSPFDGIGAGGASGRSTRGRRVGDKPDLSTRRVRTVLEHHPRDVRVLVNGFEIGRQRIAGDCAELTLRVTLPEPIALIEVMSEQGVCLLALDAEPPPAGPATHTLSTPLSEGREVSACLTFDDCWPTVSVTYRGITEARRAPGRALSALAGRRKATADTDASSTDTHARLSRGPASGWGAVRFEDLQRAWRAMRRADVLRRVTRRWKPAPIRSLAVVVLLFVAALIVWPGSLAAAERTGRALWRALWTLVSAPRRSELPPAVPPPLAARSISLTSGGVAAVTPPPPRRPPTSDRDRRTEDAATRIAVLQRLQRVRAYLGQEVAPFMTENGTPLTVTVGSSARERELTAAIGSLVDTGAARVRHRGAGRPSVSSSASAPLVVRDYEIAADRIPAHDLVLRYFLSQVAPDGPVDATPAVRRDVERDIQVFAREMLQRSEAAAVHLWALHHLARGFSDRTIQSLPPAARSAWLAIVRHHASAYRADIEHLAAALAPLVTVSAASGASPAPSAASHPDVNSPNPIVPGTLSRQTDTLRALNAVQEQAVSGAFAVTPDGGDPALLDDSAFWRTLGEIDRLARALVQSTESPHP